jgi:kynurenine formamidase
MGRGLGALRNVQIIDLSLPISQNTMEPDPPRIDYIDHLHAAHELAAAATHFIRRSAVDKATSPTITPDAFQDHLGLANENLHLDTHAGTHMDAPWHYGPLCESKPSKTIDQIPLDWCFAPGVVLDLRHKPSGTLITPGDLQTALLTIGYTLRPGDIVLLMTGADKHFTQNDYFSAHAGMGRDATLWLLDQGIRIIGIDGWGFDRPANVMLEDYLKTKNPSALFPAHLTGREREYCQIENMGTLDRIPVPYGFWVACFPVKVERGSAGWVRAVAFVEEGMACA